MASLRTSPRITARKTQVAFSTPSMVFPAQRRPTVLVLASRKRLGSGVPRAPGAAGRKLALLAAVADLCEVQGLSARFESLAGRSAMLGVSTALVVELLTEESLLRPVQGAVEAYAALAAACMLAAGIAAVLQDAGRASRQEVPLLLEPVLTSLTAVKRSSCSLAAGAMGRERLLSLDYAVDDVLTHAFTRDRINVLTDASAYEDDDA